MNKPYVALVGRPNTGKSTLFNKLAGKRISIVENTPGVTRDRIIAESNWNGSSFFLIDTGGIEPESSDVILSQMRSQAQIAMEMADVIVFVVDAKDGITAADREIASMIRKNSTKCILAVNKTDSWEKAAQAYEFYDLGLNDPMPISAEHGLGMGDLLDEIVSRFPEDQKNIEQSENCKIAVVGKPNAGKSTLINTLLGENRLIVSDVAGTTRDSIDTEFSYDEHTYTLIDTAGIKRKTKSDLPIEYYSMLRAVRSIERSDVCLLMIDAVAGVSEQDTKIAGLIQDANKAVVIIMNKWDLVKKETNTMAEMEKDIRRKLHFIDYAPILFLSAIDGKRTDKIMPTVLKVIEQYERRIPTGLLNEVIGNAVSMNPTPSKGGRHLRIYYVSQVSVKPPSVVLFVNDETLSMQSYTRYLEGKIRETFSFEGTPIRILYRNKEKKG
ncbi:MAG: ribosome biogenesis GTPase Der [Anaerofustis sp.]